jgi:hypothetical protein
MLIICKKRFSFIIIFAFELNTGVIFKKNSKKHKDSCFFCKKNYIYILF